MIKRQPVRRRMRRKTQGRNINPNQHAFDHGNQTTQCPCRVGGAYHDRACRLFFQQVEFHRLRAGTTFSVLTRDGFFMAAATRRIISIHTHKRRSACSRTSRTRTNGKEIAGENHRQKQCLYPYNERTPHQTIKIIKFPLPQTPTPGNAPAPTPDQHPLHKLPNSPALHRPPHNILSSSLRPRS
jgi:hypothetical protein